MTTEAAKYEKWMRQSFFTKDAKGAWANALRFFGQYGISVGDGATAQVIQSRFMTAAYNSDTALAQAALFTLVDFCKMNHGLAEVTYLPVDLLPSSEMYADAPKAGDDGADPYAHPQASPM